MVLPGERHVFAGIRDDDSAWINFWGKGNRPRHLSVASPDRVHAGVVAEDEVVAIGYPAANPVRVLPGRLPQLSATLDVETRDCASLGRRDQDCFSYHRGDGASRPGHRGVDDL